ncbi:MAG TPA: hypothetical protein VN969_12010 [Streptosporangiaceae bacterium]|nr:hypothetical protein [Streptosporangiaceae bacterium]
MSSADDPGTQPAVDQDKPERPQEPRETPTRAADGTASGAADADGKAEAPDETASTPAASDQHATRDAQEQLSSLLGSYFHANIFNGPVDGSNAMFGTSGGSGREDSGRRARTGRLTEEETSALCEHFAEPPLFRAATEALDRDRVVVLGGAGGLGKRTSAVHLLLNAGAARLEVVSPALTLEELSKHDFEEGHGYLAEDWQLTPGTDASDFSWRVLRDHVSDAKAHLVITTGTSKGGRAVERFAWQAPPVAQVLAACTAGGDAAGRIAEIAEKVPDTCGVGDLAVIGQRLADGEDPAKILEELAHDPGRHVREWLSAEARTDDEIQLVITLSFAAGQSQRIFEAMLSRLGSTLRGTGLLPDPEHEKEDADDGDRDRAAPRSRGLSASRTRRHPNELIERNDGRVHFRGRDASYRYLIHRHVLQELWAEYDMTFWIAVRGWLTELIGDTTIHDVQVSVALGLTVLASAALDEVEDSYLHSWAAGEQAWSGQCTAVYVLWLMSRDDTLAPIALRIATRWVNSGDPARQWTGAAALSGELGVVYPAEAAARLWHLVGQWKDVPAKAVVAMAGLFATLVREADGHEAYRVLELLRERLDRAIHRNDEDGSARGQPSVSWRDDRKNRERARLCIVGVLTARDPKTKQPSITSLLNARPEHMDLVAGLWATVLVYRPYRSRALIALLDAVRGFEYVSDDPQTTARALGDALTEALPADEHLPLNRDFTNILARSKHPETDTAATVQALLDALKHLEPKEGTGP